MGDRIVGSKIVDSNEGSGDGSGQGSGGPRHQISIYDVENSKVITSMEDFTEGYTYQSSNAKFDMSDNLICCMALGC